MNPKKFSNFYLLVFLLITSQIFSQTNPVFDQNIALPENGGNQIYDIINANNKIFVYSPKNIIVYDAITENKIGIIPVSTDSSKFNPIYYYQRLWIADNNLMAYNSNNHLLYVVKPNMDILVINVSDNNFNIVTTWPAPANDQDQRPIGHLKPIHSFCVLKYDNIHNRLYWIIRGKHSSSPTGLFHYLDSFIGVYKITLNGTHREIIGSRLFENGPGNDYTNSFNDVEYTETGNYFYLARKHRVDAFNISVNASGNETCDLDNPDIQFPTDNCKFSKLLYIAEENKIVTIPYRLPADGWEPPVNQKIHFYVIDVNTNSVDSVIAPHKKNIDAAYVPDGQGKGFLFFCYEPKGLYNYYLNGEANFNKIDSSNIAVYRYSNNSFDPEVTGKEPQFIKSDNDTLYPYDINLNRPLKFIVQSNDYVVVSKTHEIIRLHKVISETDTSFIAEDTPLFTSISSHFFKGVTAMGKLFILNLTKSGMEIFNGSNHTTKQTGFPVYESVANPVNGKIYFYNRLNSHHTNIFAYSISTHIIDVIPSNSPIGDMIYNPYTNTVLFSENDQPQQSQPVNVYAIGDNNSVTPVISLPNKSYLGKMFISPEQKLYISANMRNEDPVFYIFDADSYAQIGNQTVNGLPMSNGFVSYVADYTYCCNNTYAIISINNAIKQLDGDNGQENSTLDPYFSIPNSCIEYRGYDSNFSLTGYLLRFNSTGFDILLNNLHGARQVLCTGQELTDTTENMCNNKLYINGYNLTVYNVQDGSIQTLNKNFNHIVFSKPNNKVYGFSDEPHNGTEGYHRVSAIYEITESENGLSNQLLYTYDGQLASFFYNPYNNMLYFHTKTDASRLGADPMTLYQINLTSQGQGEQSVSLQNHSYYTEVDYDEDYHYYNYNLTTPYIDPYQNKIYLPNGGHSNVSVVSFTPDEPLNLHAGITWFSFPRLLSRDGQGNENSNLALNNNIVPQNFTSNDNETFIENQPIGTNNNYRIKSYWNKNNNTWGWGLESNLNYVNSLYGYKITLKPDENRTLFLKGTVEDPSATVDLKCSDGNGASHIDNWIGYFLYREQNVFDALGTALDDIFSIQHQDYTCYRYHYPVPEFCGSKSTSDYSPGTWICDGKPVIKYGDMIIVNTLRDIDNFQWHQTGGAEEYAERPQPEYYVYEEKPDYSTFVIELDTTQSNPVEIGAFVNDTCIGSTAVLATDSAVVLRGYLNGQNGDSVTFEEHYAARSTENKKIKEYYVINPSDFSAEKRNIKIGERKSYYLVSFNQNKYPNPHRENKLFLVGLYPNPASKNLTLQYNLIENEKVLVTVLDITGREVLKNRWQQTKGEHQSSIDTRKLKNGMYLLQLSAGNQTVVKRFLINR